MTKYAVCDDARRTRQAAVGGGADRQELVGGISCALFNDYIERCKPVVLNVGRVRHQGKFDF